MFIFDFETLNLRVKEQQSNTLEKKRGARKEKEFQFNRSMRQVLNNFIRQTEKK